jgi:hypothetical protein
MFQGGQDNLMDETNKVELERLRQRLGMMNDVELLQFRDVAAKKYTSNDAQVDSLREMLKIQSEEAKAEWKRRYPSA